MKKNEQTKHTPGPWQVSRWYQGKIDQTYVSSASKSVCLLMRHDKEEPYGIDQEEEQANARLIAAAPETAEERDRLKETNAELLEALKDSDSSNCWMCKRLNPQHKDCTSCEEHDARLKAIAQAEGA